MPRDENNIYTSIEIGTSTIKVALAEACDDDGSIDLLALSEYPSLRVLKGEILSSGIVAEQLRMAVDQTLAKVGLDHIPRGPIVTVVSSRFMDVKMTSHSEDTNPQIPLDLEFVTEFLHNSNTRMPEATPGYATMNLLLDKYFRLDNGSTYFDPQGQSTSKLTIEQLYIEIDEHYLTILQNLILPRALNRRRATCLCYAPIAIASSVFPPFDGDGAQGLVIDIGAGMTSYAIPTRMGFLDLGQIAVGCDHIANDIYLGLGLDDIDRARQLLDRMEVLRCSAIATHDSGIRHIALKVRNTDTERNISSESLETIIEARLTEIFDLVRKQLIQTQSWKRVGNEIMLSGGVTTIPGVVELARKVFERPVKIATPLGVHGQGLPPSGLPARYNTVLGAIKFAHRDRLITLHNSASADSQGCFSRLKGRITELWKNLS